MIPLKKEAQAFRKALETMGLTHKQQHLKGQSYWQIPQWNAVVALGGYGKTQMGIQTQFWLQGLEAIKEVYCLGTAGGLGAETQALDVVWGTRTVEHDFKNLFPQLAPPPQFPSSIPRESSDSAGDFRVFEGPIASGDEDILSPQRVDELIQQTSALAVAWEGAGAARAALFNQCSFVEVRGISDNARADVASDFVKNLPQAMAHIAQTLATHFEQKKARV